MPTISTLTRTGGKPGDDVTITGSGFGAAAGTVRFGEHSATVTEWTDTSIACTVPSDPAPPAGNVALTVETDGAGSVATVFWVYELAHIAVADAQWQARQVYQHPETADSDPEDRTQADSRDINRALEHVDLLRRAVQAAFVDGRVPLWNAGQQRFVAAELPSSSASATAGNVWIATGDGAESGTFDNGRPFVSVAKGAAVLVHFVAAVSGDIGVRLKAAAGVADGGDFALDLAYHVAKPGDDPGSALTAQDHFTVTPGAHTNVFAVGPAQAQTLQLAVEAGDLVLLRLRRTDHADDTHDGALLVLDLRIEVL